MDDKGLDLSLGLPCGGSSSNSKDRNGDPNSADARTDDTDERTNKILNDFKNFLNAGIPQSLQRIAPIKPQENFFTNFSSGNGQVSGDKRKNMFGDMNGVKKQETDSHSSDLQDNTKGKTSHLSIATDEGSTADNEEVAESEAEGSTSRAASHLEEGSRARTPVGNGSSSHSPNEKIRGKENAGEASFLIQSLNKLNGPYSIGIKESPSVVSTPSSSSYPHSTSPGSVPMTFGYSPVQIPVLDGNSSWGMVARPQSLHSPYAVGGMSTSVPMQVTTPSSSEAVRPDMHLLDHSRNQPKQPVPEEGSSSRSQSEEERANTFASDYPAIKPGIAADVKFGGSGSFPNLPWVSTTGPGPNGRTISGVTYKFNATQIKIVCACHGTHLTPDEFIRHASEEDPTIPRVATLPSSSPAASAKS